MDPKKLGFGLMRLPKQGKDIDLEQVCAMADRFLEAGFTYFDTAYVYEGSEDAFREAVVKRHPRERYTVATKLAGWQLKEGFGPADMLEFQLKRCGVDYFDYYLLHSLHAPRDSAYDRWGCWDYCLAQREAGRIRHFGFSFHGTPEELDELLTLHPQVDFVQLQINYLDWDNDAIQSRRCYETARRHGKPIVVMEPVKGGLLANLRPDVRTLFQAAAPSASPASFALRYAAGLEGVMMVLSGMSDLAQMEDNLSTFADLRPLAPQELSLVEQARDAILSAPTIGCTKCRYCVEGCPVQIDIPAVFQIVNRLALFGDHAGPRERYERMVRDAETARASDCLACGQCEGICPQHLPIIELLRSAAHTLEA